MIATAASATEVNTSFAAYKIKGQFIGGWIYPHDASIIKPLAKGPVLGGEIAFELASDGSKQWHKDFNMPDLGFALQVLDLGNPEIMGQMIAESLNLDTAKYGLCKKDNYTYYMSPNFKKDNTEYNLSQLQEIIKKEDIPLGPNSDTLGITFRVGQIEMDNGNYQNAADCFAMVYDLSCDEEVKVLMEEAISKIN